MKLAKKIAALIFILIMNNLQFSNAQFFNEDAFKFVKLYSWLESYYVDSVDYKKLSDNAIREILKHLDPHSVYLTKDEVPQVNEPLQGSFSGIGISFVIYKDSVLVIKSKKDSPAYHVGIKAGDRIIEIDSLKVSGIGITKTEVFSHLRGIPGTTLRLKLFRKSDQKIYQINLKRDKIAIESIESAYLVNKSTGYVKLCRFSAYTNSEIVKSFEFFKNQKISNIIIDLRGNTGGYLDAAVFIADQFIDSGKLIVYTKSIRNDKKEYFSTQTGLLENTQVAVLIDENTASASEILAGAIQDWDRGTIIGKRSFGKGLVQQHLNFPDGSLVRLTVARYYTPCGRLIQKNYNSREYPETKMVKDYYKVTPELEDTFSHKTLVKKRLIYGGGGIMPDILVETDTSRDVKVFENLKKAGLLYSFAVEYVDNNREYFEKKYSDFKTFNSEFKITSEIIKSFIKYATPYIEANDKIELTNNNILVNTELKGNIALIIWSLNEYYEIVNTIDPGFEIAINALQNSMLK